MKTWIHSAVSLILTALLYPIFNWKAAFIIAGGVLIDIDHYFWYVYQYNDFSLIKSYKFYIKNIERNDFSNVMGLLLVFHTIEFFLIMVFLSFYSVAAFMFTLGLMAHYILDVIYTYHKAKGAVANHSMIYWVYKNLIQKV